MITELVIKVDNHHIYLSPGLTIPIQQTNIPSQHCRFRTHADIFWKIELLEYIEQGRCWRVKVTDYFVKDTTDFDRQRSTKEIRRIRFEKFDWLQLEKHLSDYRKIKLLDILANPDAERFTKEELKSKSFPPSPFRTESNKLEHPKLTEAQLNAIIFNPPALRPYVRKFDLDFSFYFSEAHFKQGYVSFTRRIKEVGDNVDFKIINDFVRPEFDSIRSWFAKKLHRKFKVFASISTHDGRVTDVHASSPEIDMINSELVDSIRHERTVLLTRPRKASEGNKALFTLAEVFVRTESTDMEGNIFNQTEQEILGALLDTHPTRNRKQLEYLSGAKQSQSSKLRFTLHPHFGFLFFVEGERNHHFVWELLDSHATYIWSLEKLKHANELQYERIEACINTIRANGRDEYKRAYRNDSPAADLAFSFIDHDDITSDQVDGFVKWKRRLDQRLT